MPRVPLIGRRDEGPSGGPERSQASGDLRVLKADPHAGVVGALAGETERLPDRGSIIGELNLLTGTKSLPAEDRENIADRVLRARDDKLKGQQA